MRREEIKLGDTVSIPKNAFPECASGTTGIVIGIYPNVVLIEYGKHKFKLNVMNCDLDKINLLMHKPKDTLEKVYEDVLDSLS